MQTFLPYFDFKMSASVLDRQRLGKQRVEAWQIYLALTEPDYGWKNHPAVKMWNDDRMALLAYGIDICTEWRKRGYKDTMLVRFQKALQRLNKMRMCYSEPDWIGCERLHGSHRAALLAKNPEHYSELGWTEEPMDLTLKPLPYYWPVK